MKNWSLVFLSFLFSQFLIAQADFVERQIGLDATAFITRFLSFNAASSGTSNPQILFLYRKEKDGKHLRYGIGGRFNFSKNKENDSESSILSMRLDYKFGREYHKNISKRWRTYLGWDTLFGVSVSSSKFSNQNNSSKSISRSANVSINPLVGIQFSLNNRLSLFTEMAYGMNLFVRYAENSSGSLWRYSVETFYAPPISLFLNYKI